MNKKGLLLVFGTAMISGFSVFINKYGVAMNNPYVFAFLKNLAVAVLLASLIMAVKEYKFLRRVSVKQWGLLALIGIVGGGIPFLLFFKGLSLTSAAQGSFIQKTMFLYVALLAVVFLKEKLSKSFLAGAILLLGANLLLLKSFNFSFGRGDLLIFCATLFWAIENIISKYALKNLSGNIVACSRMLFGSVFIAGFLLFTGQITQVLALNFSQIGWIALTTLFLLGYTFTWYNGLKYVPVSVATAILMLGSPVTTLLAALSSGKLIAKDIFASFIIITGLTIIIGLDYVFKKIRFCKNFNLIP